MKYDREELLEKINTLVADWFYRDLDYDSPPSEWLDRAEEMAAVVVRIAAVVTGDESKPYRSVEDMMTHENTDVRPSARDRASKQVRPGGEIWKARQKWRGE